MKVALQRGELRCQFAEWLHAHASVGMAPHIMPSIRSRPDGGRAVLAIQRWHLLLFSQAIKPLAVRAAGKGSLRPFCFDFFNGGTDCGLKELGKVCRLKSR
jgi:hypothetical protein